eukprot:g17949.t1
MQQALSGALDRKNWTEAEKKETQADFDWGDGEKRGLGSQNFVPPAGGAHPNTMVGAGGPKGRISGWHHLDGSKDEQCTKIVASGRIDLNAINMKAYNPPRRFLYRAAMTGYPGPGQLTPQGMPQNTSNLFGQHHLATIEAVKELDRCAGKSDEEVWGLGFAWCLGVPWRIGTACFRAYKISADQTDNAASTFAEFACGISPGREVRERRQRDAEAVSEALGGASPGGLVGGLDVSANKAVPAIADGRVSESSGADRTGGQVINVVAQKNLIDYLLDGDIRGAIQAHDCDWSKDKIANKMKTQSQALLTTIDVKIHQFVHGNKGTGLGAVQEKNAATANAAYGAAPKKTTSEKPPGPYTANSGAAPAAAAQDVEEEEGDGMPGKPVKMKKMAMKQAKKDPPVVQEEGSGPAIVNQTFAPPPASTVVPIVVPKNGLAPQETVPEDINKPAKMKMKVMKGPAGSSNTADPPGSEAPADSSASGAEEVASGAAGERSFGPSAAQLEIEKLKAQLAAKDKIIAGTSTAKPVANPLPVGVGEADISMVKTRSQKGKATGGGTQKAQKEQAGNDNKGVKKSNDKGGRGEGSKNTPGGASSKDTNVPPHLVLPVASAFANFLDQFQPRGGKPPAAVGFTFGEPLASSTAQGTATSAAEQGGGRKGKKKPKCVNFIEEGEVCEEIQSDDEDGNLDNVLEHLQELGETYVPGKTELYDDSSDGSYEKDEGVLGSEVGDDEDEEEEDDDECDE